MQVPTFLPVFMYFTYVQYVETVGQAFLMETSTLFWGALGWKGGGGGEVDYSDVCSFYRFPM